MTQSPTEVFQHFTTTVRSGMSFLIPICLIVLTCGYIVKAQSRGGAPGGSGYPGPAARENNRSMDEYDRTINRMKNDAKAVKERRLNLFPKINEDFQHIQMIHNEIVRMVGPDKVVDYDRLA